jgi:segregation and condensation protein B
VEGVGRAEVVGRPMTYGTTPAFLEYFGLRSLEDLPAADELRRIVVQKPEALLTVEPGLATATPDTLKPDAANGAPNPAPADPGTAVPATAETPAAPPVAPETTPEPGT